MTPGASSGRGGPSPFVVAGARTKDCPGCRVRLDLRAELCPACGMGQSVVRGCSRTMAAALAIAFGTVGAHRFYLGRPGSGTVYLLFCWTLIPTIVGICEGLFYLTLSEQDFARRFDPDRWTRI